MELSLSTSRHRRTISIYRSTFSTANLRVVRVDDTCTVSSVASKGGGESSTCAPVHTKMGRLERRKLVAGEGYRSSAGKADGGRGVT